MISCCTRICFYNHYPNPGLNHPVHQAANLFLIISYPNCSANQNSTILFFIVIMAYYMNNESPSHYGPVSISPYFLPWTLHSRQVSLHASYYTISHSLLSQKALPNWLMSLQLNKSSFQLQLQYIIGTLFLYLGISVYSDKLNVFSSLLTQDCAVMTPTSHRHTINTGD